MLGRPDTALLSLCLLPSCSSARSFWPLGCCVVLPSLLFDLCLCLPACLSGCLSGCLSVCLPACLPAWRSGVCLEKIAQGIKLLQGEEEEEEEGEEGACGMAVGRREAKAGERTRVEQALKLLERAQALAPARRLELAQNTAQRKHDAADQLEGADCDADWPRDTHGAAGTTGGITLTDGSGITLTDLIHHMHALLAPSREVTDGQEERRVGRGDEAREGLESAPTADSGSSSSCSNARASSRRWGSASPDVAT